jgi:hypothetical protein
VRAVIERLSGEPADRLRPLVAESERQGFRFVRRLVEEWTRGVNRFDRPGEVLFAARSGDDVVGVCGLNVDPYADDPPGRPSPSSLRAGPAPAGRHRRAPGGRRHRIRARPLRPAAPAPTSAAAARFYERLGFRSTPGASHRSHALHLEDPA